MARRKVRDEAEAVMLVEEARRRGVKPSLVASERGVDGRSIQAWSMVLAKKKRRPTRGQSTFLELVPTRASAPRSYRVWVGELSVDVPEDFDQHTVHRLLMMLQGC